MSLFAPRSPADRQVTVTEVGTRDELTQAAYARFREAAERYGDGAGEMTVCKVIEDDAGVELRVPGAQSSSNLNVSCDLLQTAADGRGDDVTVDALFQAHTFEDRVLKIDYVDLRDGCTIGPNTVILYGADVGARARVAPHSVVMKREVLLADTMYEGAPTQPV